MAARRRHRARGQGLSLHLADLLARRRRQDRQADEGRGARRFAGARHAGRRLRHQPPLAQLGLAETASATDAIAAIASLKAGDPNKFVPKAQYDETVTALSAAQATIAAGQQAAKAALCATLVGDAIRAGKIAPAAKDQYLALAAADFDLTKAAIEAMPIMLKAGEDKAAQGDPTVGAEGKLSDAEKTMAASLGVTEAAFLAARA